MNILKAMAGCFLFLLPLYNYAQLEFLSESVLRDMEKMKVSINLPESYEYEGIKGDTIVFYRYDFELRFKKPGITTRVAFFPYDSSDVATIFPHVLSGRYSSSVAANSDSTEMTVLALNKALLEGRFNADWGKEFYFKPKKTFIDRRHCQMIAVFKEGRGLVVVMHLFNKIPQNLEEFYRIIRFED